MVGISIVLQQQMFSSMTFCALIKQQFPHIHVTIGGNTVTRLRDVLPQSPLFQYFDSAVVYEGETAFLQLVEAVGAKRSSGQTCPIPSIRTTRACMTSPLSYAEDMAALPPPDFDGLPLEKYFVPTNDPALSGDARLLLGPLRVLRPWRGLYGRLPHEEDPGHARRDQVSEGQVRRRGIFTSPTNPIRRPSFESWRVGWSKRRWTSSGQLTCGSRRACWKTHVWEDAKQSGCRYLHFGYESGDRAGAEADGQGDDDGDHRRSICKLSADVGIWNHCMGFFGFPGETREEAWSSVRVPGSRTRTMSIRSGSARSIWAGTTPVAKHPEQWGVTAYKNPGMGSGARLLLHREERAEHRRGGAGVRGIRAQPQSGLGSAPVHPRIHFPLHRAVRHCRSCRILQFKADRRSAGVAPSLARC